MSIVAQLLLFIAQVWLLQWHSGYVQPLISLTQSSPVATSPPLSLFLDSLCSLSSH